MTKSFFTALNSIARQIERNARATERNKLRLIKEKERHERDIERTLIKQAREQYNKERFLSNEIEKEYVGLCKRDVEIQNNELESYVTELSQLLMMALAGDVAFGFDEMKRSVVLPDLDLSGVPSPQSSPIREDYIPQRDKWFVAWLPWVKKEYKSKCIVAEIEYNSILEAHKSYEVRRQNIINKTKSEHESLIKRIVEKTKKHNSDVDDFKKAFESGDDEAVSEFFRLVLSSSLYPKCFPRQVKSFYVVESKQLLIDIDLPCFDDAIPFINKYKYVSSDRSITTTKRPDSQRKSLYKSVVAQVVLRSLYEIYNSDEGGRVETVVINGYVDAINRENGKSVRPCIITVRVTRDIFFALNLKDVDPLACLHGLNASVSKHPDELAPVRPILEMNMVDPRFVQEIDVLSNIDNRQNLMELTPGEFESLITNLFQKMGLETKLTQASRDGGVDCVAYDTRPIFGGKVIIQAKRYKNTVGVSAVRDLFGTMQNEGASKGILVTTSGYGKAAFDFANGKPMELLSGSNLLYLLHEHAGIDAKIIVPEDWKEPVFDN
ncbi:MAG: restriction endonuclease [Solidesulfovibrio sp.]